MKQAGITMEQALEALREVEVQPVFTAHPTEITRRAVLLKRRRIAAELETLDQLPLSDIRARAGEDIIQSEITALWQTDEVRLQRPTVLDEIRTGISYYVMTLFDAAERVYEGIAADFLEVYGADVDMLSLPVCLKFGSWIGGDRDGNPFVTPDCTREALELARSMVLSHYIQGLSMVVRSLTVSTHQVPVSPELQERLEEYERKVAEPATELARTPNAEAYRRLLLMMGTRLRFARDEPAHAAAYRDAVEFADDLLILRRSLCASGGARLARELLDPLLSKLRTFGFRLHTLDIRQHAKVHQRALEEIGQVGATQAAGTRIGELSSRTIELLETFRSVTVAKQSFEPEAILRYIVSGAEREDDVFAVLRLGALSGLRPGGQAGDPGSCRSRSSNRLRPSSTLRKSCGVFGVPWSTRRCCLRGMAGKK